jgi:hypothetical protein
MERLVGFPNLAVGFGSDSRLFKEVQPFRKVQVRRFASSLESSRGNTAPIFALENSNIPLSEY